MKLIQELLSIYEGKKFTDNLEWMDGVKAAYPEVANKLKFKGRVEDGKNLMFAEIPGEDRCYGVFDMDKDEGEVLSENIFGQGTSISDYNKYAEWIEMAHAKLFDKFGEDEDKWEAFEKAMADETSDDQMQVFMDQPSADKLHYNSNGRPDQGKTLEFLENFEDFKRSFKRIFDRFLHH
jgi:hypothetical protein